MDKNTSYLKDKSTISTPKGKFAYFFLSKHSKYQNITECNIKNHLQNVLSKWHWVPDPVFADKVLGDGFAVIPADGRIYAPADGEVAMVFDTLHAVTLTSTQGAEILIHIGLDTVTLKGEPFKAHVAAGDKVKKGDLLIEADLDKIEKAGLNTIIPVLICNTDDYGKISLQKEGDVSADEAVLKLS